MPEDNDNEDLEVNYNDSNKENQPPIPPLGFITNSSDHPFFYHIYVRNPLYCANEGDWTHKRLIVAPFVKYSADYTQVEGSVGEGTTTCSCPVQLDRRVPTHTHMTPNKWRNMQRGHEKEFAINMALTQINNPKYNGEINCFRGLSDLQDTLERLMRDTQGQVMEVMKELVTVQGQLDLCKKRLEISNSDKELNHHFRLANPVLTCPQHSPVRSPSLRHPVLSGQSPHSHLALEEWWRCPSSTTMTPTAVALPDATGARWWGM